MQLDAVGLAHRSRIIDGVSHGYNAGMEHDPKVQELIDLALRLLGEMVLSRPDMTAATVAAAIRTKSGRVFTGVCLHVSCGIGFCAEHAAVAEMVKGRETQIEMIAAISEDGVLAPCGRCRELMVQVDSRNFDAQVALPDGRVVSLRELLPDHWITE